MSTKLKIVVCVVSFTQIVIYLTIAVLVGIPTYQVASGGEYYYKLALLTLPDDQWELMQSCSFVYVLCYNSALFLSLWAWANRSSFGSKGLLEGKVPLYVRVILLCSPCMRVSVCNVLGERLEVWLRSYEHANCSFASHFPFTKKHHSKVIINGCLDINIRMNFEGNLRMSQVEGEHEEDYNDSIYGHVEDDSSSTASTLTGSEKLPRIAEPDWSDSEETVVLTPGLPGNALPSDSHRDPLLDQGSPDQDSSDHSEQQQQQQQLEQYRERIAQLKRENLEIRADRDSLLRYITFGRSENAIARDQLQTDLLEVLESELGCVICNDVFMEPVVVECGHIFCHHCISSWLNQPNGRNCPTCLIVVTKPLRIKGLEGYIGRLYTLFPPQVQQEWSQVLVETQVENESREEDRIRRAAGGSIVANVRTLYSASALGIYGYEKQRQRVQSQFTGMADKFREKMREFTLADSTNMIFTEDLKNVLHLAEKKPEDLALLLQMLKKYNSQNKHLRFGNYIFGPVVMRTYHFLNAPAEALALVRDPELDGMFDQLVTYQILMDLLYQNEMYQDVLDLLEVLQEKQVQGVKFPKNAVVLAMASCWKMNTLESYEFSLKILNDMKTAASDPVRRAISYAASLALKQNAPQVALEILSSSRNANYVTVRNLKIQALADLNRPDDTFPILRYSIENENPDSERKISVCPDVMEKVAASVERLGNKDVSLEFERINKALKETNQIGTETLDAFLDSVIDILPRTQNNSTREMQRDAISNSYRSNGAGQRMSIRPRQNPSYSRERQSLRYEY